MISANGAAYAWQYSCNHASVNLEPTFYYQKLLLFFSGTQSERNHWWISEKNNKKKYAEKRTYYLLSKFRETWNPTLQYKQNRAENRFDCFFSRSGKQNHHIHIFSGVCLQEHMQRAICLPVIRSYSHRFSLFAAWTRTTVVQHYSYSIAQGDNITVPHVDRYTATEHDQCILRYAQ